MKSTLVIVVASYSTIFYQSDRLVPVKLRPWRSTYVTLC